MSSKYLHFTIGPVHSFVLQARRTRDYWAGSFLLSWLTGVGMYAAKSKGAELVIPTLPTTMERAFSGTFSREDDDHFEAFCELRFGRLPNKATIRLPDGIDDAQAVALVREIIGNIESAWKGLADHVWLQDFEPFFESEDYEKKAQVVNNWNKQVNHFFDIRWCVNESISGGESLFKRGLWRTPNNPIANQNILKCMIAKDLPELSGQEKTSEAKARFWDKLRQYHFKADKDKLRLIHDIRDGELLSAISYIKRRFSAVLNNEHNGTGDEKVSVNGWHINPRVPSTPYIAAAPWLAQLIQGLKTANDQIEAQSHVAEFRHAVVDLLNIGFVKNVNQLKNEVLNKGINEGLNEELGSAECTKKAAESHGWLQSLAKTDGPLFFENELENYRSFEGFDAATDPFQKKSARALKALKKLKTYLPEHTAALNPHYAMISMDGDKFGDLLKALDHQYWPAFNQMLASFTGQVDEVVKSHDGFLVYVGGEDVVALTPAQTALECAIKLRAVFSEEVGTFNKTHGLKHNVTASTAVCFTHYKVPLSQVTRESEQLLGEVAKDECGRDAIAIRHLGQGHTYFTWSSPWRDFSPDFVFNNASLHHLASLLSGKRFGRSFIYRAKQRIEEFKGVGDPEILKGMLLSDLGRSGYNQSKEGALDPDWIEKILDFAQVRTNTPLQQQAESAVKYSTDALAALLFVAELLPNGVNAGETL